MKNNLLLWIFVLLFAALMSIPWLVPHTGALVLIGFVPLLMAEDFATQLKIKRFWMYHYSAFVLWNAITTFWVCNATVGGGIFAVLANALQMSLIFGLFRLSRKRLGGVLPYVFLAVMWIAWERWYLQSAQISWPWLVLGNAFARSTRLVQWYSVTGTLGGSLWVWACNLGIYGLLVSLADGSGRRWTDAARLSCCMGLTLVLIGPVVTSAIMYRNCGEVSEDSVEVIVGQPNFDPYEKFTSMTQAEQTDVLLDQFREQLDSIPGPALLVAPETFTSDVWIHGDTVTSATIDRFRLFLGEYPGCTMLTGAGSAEHVRTRSRPSRVARQWGDGWIRSHNSAIALNPGQEPEIFHKSKLVVGTELMPYPWLFDPLDRWLGKMMGVGGLIGRCEGQDEISVLHTGDVPFGCAVCYESVYGEYCAGYVRKGARFLAVITNDAWWGDTPGYKQHFSYSRLRAIETRRDIARCGNTGISAFIDQRGDVIQKGPWWERTTVRGNVNLSSKETFFVRYGDMVGRICTFAFLLLLALLLARFIVPRR